MAQVPMRIILSFLVIFSLTACEIEGGVPTETPLGTNTETLPPEASQPAPQPSETAQAQETGTITIGLLESDQPRDLFPYHTDSSDARATAPITNLLYPPPILAYNYTYTVTNVLERVPTLENGGAVLQPIDQYLDAAGNITTTVTEVITQVQQIVVTYNWSHDLHWADGTPVTAHDSVFAYETAKKVNLGEEANSKLALLDRYEAVDDYTTRAYLKPDYLDPTYMTTVWTPLPRHILGDTPAEEIFESEWAKAPIGYGPYTFAKRDTGSIRLERNTHYVGKQPAEQVIFSFLPSVDALRVAVLNGRIDVASAERIPTDQFPFLAQHESQGLMRVAFVDNPIWEHLDFNLDVPILQDYRVRRAIAYGINRQAMVEELFSEHGSVLESWILPKQWGAASKDEITRYKFSPEQANALLDEGGYIDTDGDGIREANGEPIALSLITTANTPIRSTAANRIVADLGSIGIKVEVQELPIGELYRLDGPLFQRQFELSLFGWLAGVDPAGYSLWSCKAVPSEANGWTGNNFSGWCFRDADRAISVATTSLDPEERRQAYLTQQQLFTQEVPMLPLFQRLTMVMVNPNLEGVKSDATAPLTWNISDWTRS